MRHGTARFRSRASHRCMLVLRRRRRSEHYNCAGCGCHPSRGATAKRKPANTPCPNGRTSRICRPDLACSSHVLASVGSATDRCLPASTECYGALWDTLPELGIVPENNASTGGFERLQPIKRCHHCFAVENMARQTSFMERLAKVTGICRKHGIATGQPYPERLVTRRVAVEGMHTTEPSPKTSYSPSISRRPWPIS